MITKRVLWEISFGWLIIAIGSTLVRDATITLKPEALIGVVLLVSGAYWNGFRVCIDEHR